MKIKARRTVVDYIDVDVSPLDALDAIRKWLLTKNEIDVDAFVYRDGKIKVYDEYGDLKLVKDSPTADELELMEVLSKMSSLIKKHK